MTRPTIFTVWLLGVRPRTLPASIVPVLVGTAAAADGGLGSSRGISGSRFVLTLLVCVALQVGANFANDYSDGVRGTDDSRVGPTRLVSSGLVVAERVKMAAFASFGVAGIAGFMVSMMTSWWLLTVGAASIVAAWFYTGGSKPYGYSGFGEVFVFLFFGLVATAGSAFVQTEQLEVWPIVAAVPVGCLATALLVSNNLRDIPTDAAVHKMTLAVRLGDRKTRLLYAAMVAAASLTTVALGVVWRPWAFLGLIGLVGAIQPIRVVFSRATGKALIPVLAATGRIQLLVGTGLATGLWFGS